MDQIEKFLKKLDKKTAYRLRECLLKILTLDIDEYDVKKLKGHKNLYRARLGKVRVIFKKEEGSGLPIYVEYRGSAYK